MVLPSADILFVWDFDWTIVNCNSDEYVPSQFLGDADTERRLRAALRILGPERWHECVSLLINSCVEESDGGCSQREIREAAASMPFLADVRGALEDVANDARCGQAIVSDGNDVFIGAFLKENGLEGCFDHGVETNSGSWQDRGDGTGARFGVVYQSAKYGGHSCERCPPNLCKSQVLRTSLLPNVRRIGNSSTEDGDGRRPRVVYVGDGSNDACPALHVLNEGDVLLARDGRRASDPNSKSGSQDDAKAEEDLAKGTFPILSVLKRAKAEGGTIPKCRVSPWNSGKELRALVRGLLVET